MEKTIFDHKNMPSFDGWFHESCNFCDLTVHKPTSLSSIFLVFETNELFYNFMNPKSNGTSKLNWTIEGKYVRGCEGPGGLGPPPQKNLRCISKILSFCKI